MPQYVITKKSSNSKVGPIMVTTSARNTCPQSCPFNRENAGGCYADGGPLRTIWDRMSGTAPGETIKNGRANIPVQSFEDLLDAIKSQEIGALWRHNQAGDLPGMGDEIDGESLSQIVCANKAAGARGFTYTHKPVSGEYASTNAEYIRAANADGFTINLSANSPAHADELAALNIAPVVTVLPSTATGNTTTPQGQKITVCPAQLRDDITCATCQLCQRRERQTIVGFIAHGRAKNKVDVTVNGDKK